jgi:hypothetical protein
MRTSRGSSPAPAHAGSDGLASEGHGALTQVRRSVHRPL